MSTLARIDLDDTPPLATLAEQRRFQNAGRQHQRLRWQAMSIAGAATLVLLASTRSDTLLRTWLAAQGTALLIVALGLHAASTVAAWRHAALYPAPPMPTSDTAADAATGRFWRARLRAAWRVLIEKAQRSARSNAMRSGLQIGALLLAACVLLPALQGSLDGRLPAPILGRFAMAGTGLCVLLAFVLLVLERATAQQTFEDSPEASALAPMLRLALLSLLSGAGLLLAWRSAPPAGSAYAAAALCVLPAVVAAELLLRRLLSLLVHHRVSVEPALAIDSAIARLLQWPPRPLRQIGDELRTRLGIDLRHNWAFGYMRRALLPVAGVVLLAGWLLSSVYEVPIDGRAIHERFGQPVAVLGPGLHLTLPWPLSRRRPVENGSVHALATIVGSNDDDELDTSAAEDPAPAAANRLWDAAHISEKSQVIASLAGERQSFQVVNMDVRLIYRIGLDDASALAATYNSDDLPALIRSTAGRVLVEHFASLTLDHVLDTRREALARDVGARIQAELDAVDSGVELLATLVEQIHPPAGAANAYHGVQAALIKSQAAIARERGRAAEESNEAQLQAAMRVDRASAGAREALATAQATQTRFAAEQQAARSAGPAFVLEQYLSQLSQGLKGASLLLIDHRIGSAGTAAPTIDLRAYNAPMASNP